jgi:hypothetical protein
MEEDEMKETPQTAKGHVAKIVPFDDATILLPLNVDEVRWLMYSLDVQLMRLDKTGDFPEKEKYSNLRSNLMTCYWMLNS